MSLGVYIFYRSKDWKNELILKVSDWYKYTLTLPLTIFYPLLSIPILVDDKFSFRSLIIFRKYIWTKNLSRQLFAFAFSVQNPHIIPGYNQPFSKTRARWRKNSTGLALFVGKYLSESFIALRSPHFSHSSFEKISLYLSWEERTNGKQTRLASHRWKFMSLGSSSWGIKNTR